jgi:hypothetical protein
VWPRTLPIIHRLIPAPAPMLAKEWRLCRYRHKRHSAYPVDSPEYNIL